MRNFRIPADMRRGADAAPARSVSMVPFGRAAHRRPYDGLCGNSIPNSYVPTDQIEFGR